MESYLVAVKSADNLMKDDNYEEAAFLYDQALASLAKSTDDAEKQAIKEYWDSPDALWVMLSCIYALIKMKSFEEAFDKLRGIVGKYQHYKGFIIGNPIFHLFVGILKFEMTDNPNEQGPESPTDELSRVLICGGYPVFNLVDDKEKYLKPVLKVLRPPKGFKSWEASSGKFAGECIDLCYTSSGYMKHLLTSKNVAQSLYSDDDEVSTYPESIQCTAHKHIVTKTNAFSVNEEEITIEDFIFNCNVCNEAGAGWRYCCKECDFDMHLKCTPDANVIKP